MDIRVLRVYVEQVKHLLSAALIDVQPYVRKHKFGVDSHIRFDSNPKDLWYPISKITCNFFHSMFDLIMHLIYQLKYINLNLN